MFDIAQFRLAFPEFADTARYPTAQITFQATLVGLQFQKGPFTDDVYSTMQSLYVAHLLALNPGAGGAVASKTVGSVSISYDTASSAYQNAGFFNQTNYGKQYWNLLMMFGAGCVQL
jgi:hypothetical protein